MLSHLHKLLQLYCERLDVTQRVILQLEKIPPFEVEATILERQKWRVVYKALSDTRHRKNAIPAANTVSIEEVPA